MPDAEEFYARRSGVRLERGTEPCYEPGCGGQPHWFASLSARNATAEGRSPTDALRRLADALDDLDDAVLDGLAESDPVVRAFAQQLTNAESDPGTRHFESVDALIADLRDED